MIEKITLQKFDDNFEDYWDSENGYFVLFAGSAGIVDCKISTEAKIIDYNGTSWDCYLSSVEYISKLDMYEIHYKKY